MIMRQAKKEDLAALTAIYNYEIRHGTATFDCEEKTVQERALWLEAHNSSNHPLLVAENDGQILGYASLSTYGAKDAFASSVELSVYVHPEHRHEGIGETLARAVIDAVRGDGLTHLIISVITSDNETSVAMHRKLGFVFQGRIPEIARKFGRYLSVDIYTLSIV